MIQGWWCTYQPTMVRPSRIEIDVRLRLDRRIPSHINALGSIQLHFFSTVNVVLVVLVAMVVLEVGLHGHPEPVPHGVQGLVGNGALTIFVLLLPQSNFRWIARWSIESRGGVYGRADETHLQ